MAEQHFTPSVASTSTLDIAARTERAVQALLIERKALVDAMAAFNRAIDLLESGRKPDADDLAAFDRAVDLLRCGAEAWPLSPGLLELFKSDEVQR